MKRWVEGKSGELEHQGRNENWSGSMTSSREGCRGAGPLPVVTAQSRLGRGEGHGEVCSLWPGVSRDTEKVRGK